MRFFLGLLALDFCRALLLSDALPTVQFPHTMYMVTGSQADRPESNMLTLLQLTELHKTYVAAGA